MSMEIFTAPSLSNDETAVLSLIRDQWSRLKWILQDKPARWSGSLRQSLLARGIRGSNSIEGFTVSDDDSAAAVEGDQPFDAPAEAPNWLAVIGYKDAMTYTLHQGGDPDSRIDSTLFRSLHYMMLKHEFPKHPGSWRPGPIYVYDERTDKTVYTAPPRADVPALMEEFTSKLDEQLRLSTVESRLVTAAMAHLNLTMIHPFSDGNGRMARCIQTLVLARSGVFDPVFCSVEEWLGARSNTDEYYEVLAEVGGGSWQPSRDTRKWVRFMLKAHYQQALTAERRQQEIEALWTAIEERLDGLGLPDRMVAPLLEAAVGRSIRSSRYRHHADVNQLTASRDLKALVKAGLLADFGERRGRFYRASEALVEIRKKHRVPKQITDPFIII